MAVAGDGQRRSEQRRRTHSTHVRFTPEEWAQIQNRITALSGGHTETGKRMTPQEFVRRCALRRKLPRAVDAHMLMELQKVRGDLQRNGGLFRWWLTDGEGKDGERHVRGPAPRNHQQMLEQLMAEYRTLASRVDEILTQLLASYQNADDA
jgi:hypothetical protein